MLAHLKRGAVYQAPRRARGRAARPAQRRRARPERACAPLEAARRRQRRAGPRRTRHRTLRGATSRLDDRNAARALQARPRALPRRPARRRRSTPLQQALALDPALGEAHYVLGLVAARSGSAAGRARRRSKKPRAVAPASQTAAREALAEVYRARRRLRQGDRAARGAGGARAVARRSRWWRSAWRRRAPGARMPR